MSLGLLGFVQLRNIILANGMQHMKCNEQYATRCVVYYLTHSLCCSIG